jgi:hypothetical protein
MAGSQSDNPGYNDNRYKETGIVPAFCGSASTGVEE